jgi:hypothetical protein
MPDQIPLDVLFALLVAAITWTVYLLGKDKE